MPEDYFGIDGKRGSTRGQIISLLSEKWPLSAKEMHNSIVRKYKAKLSYQAIHKALCEMEKINVLESKDKKFQLNRRWLKLQKEFFEKTEARYNGP